MIAPREIISEEEAERRKVEAATKARKREIRTETVVEKLYGKQRKTTGYGPNKNPYGLS